MWSPQPTLFLHSPLASWFPLFASMQPCSHAPCCSFCFETLWQMFSGNAGKTVRLPDRKKPRREIFDQVFSLTIFFANASTLPHLSLSLFPPARTNLSRHKMYQASNSMGACFRSANLEAYNRLYAGSYTFPSCLFPYPSKKKRLNHRSQVPPCFQPPCSQTRYVLTNHFRVGSLYRYT